MDDDVVLPFDGSDGRHGRGASVALPAHKPF